MVSRMSDFSVPHHKDLVFEFSPIHENGIREFTVSAEGIKELFPIVEKLIESAPKIEKWQFNAFRQRIPGDEFEIQYGDFRISYSDIYFRYVDGEYGEIGIELNIRDFDDSGQSKNAIYILFIAKKFNIFLFLLKILSI